MTEEIWKPVKGYEGYYEVSNLGRVKSVERRIVCNGHEQLKKERLLTPSPAKSGYYRVALCMEGNVKHIKVHRLVALHFIPNPDELPQINHIDENKANNRADNLEWCTSEYNLNYGSRTKKTTESIIKYNLGRSKKVLMIDSCGKVVSEFDSTNDAARKTGYHQGYIASCCRGEYEKAYGYVWKYK